MISTLVAQTWIAFAVEADNAFEASATERVGRLFRISLAMWSNGLRCVDGEGVTVGELRAHARANCNLAGLERWGWIELGPPGPSRPGYGTQRGIASDTIVRPTRAGAFARRVWPDIVAQVEARWNERFGDSTMAALRAALGNNNANMPWSPPEVHPSDGFRTHVVDAPATKESDVPLVARLGQTLAALTVDYERRSEVSLPLAAVVLHALDREPAAMRELPARTGISKEAIAMAVKWLTKFKFVTVADRTVQLTGTGRAALAEPDETADGSKLRAALEAVLAQTEALAAGLTPPPGCWRASKPYVTQTNRFLADPSGALPRQPFVLHRGGWPDGS